MGHDVGSDAWVMACFRFDDSFNDHNNNLTVVRSRYTLTSSWKIGSPRASDRIMPLYVEFEIIGTIENRRIIAVGNRIRELQRLVNDFGSGRWRKMSGEAYIRFSNGDVVYAEIHWYEAHGIGQKDFGYKRTLE